MSGMTVDGLISGLSTSDLIAQLMQIEKIPQAKLGQKRDATTVLTQTYQQLNQRFATIKAAAEAIAKPEGWQAMKASTSAGDVATATATGTALPASLTFSVKQLATNHTVVAERAFATDDVIASGDLSFTVGGEAKAVELGGDFTLGNVVAKINAAKIGVSAAAVQVAPGEYRLQLSATGTGVDGAFSVDGANLAALEGPDGDADVFDVVTAGQDAVLLMGGIGGYEVRSPSNVFADVLPGVSITAVKADEATNVTVTVGTDTDAVAKKVKALVDAVNGALGSIEASSTYDPKLRKAGPLLGDSLARNLDMSLLRITGELPTGHWLSEVGISINDDGNLDFDEAKFKELYAKDPANVADVFTGASTADESDGLAVRFAAFAKAATDSQTGLITQAIKGKESLAQSYVRQIDDWDVRLEKKEAALKRQYAGLEVALSSLRNQSTWLAGQLSGLAANNG